MRAPAALLAGAVVPLGFFAAPKIEHDDQPWLAGGWSGWLGSFGCVVYGFDTAVFLLDFSGRICSSYVNCVLNDFLKMLLFWMVFY